MHAGDDRSQKRRQLQAQIVAMQGVVEDASKMYRNIKIAQYRASMHPAKHLKKPHWRKAAVIVELSSMDFGFDYISQTVFFNNRIKVNTLEVEHGYVEARLQYIIDHVPDVHVAVANSESDMHHEAAQFVAERYLYQWLVSCNVKGVAPTTAVMLEHLVVFWPENRRGNRYHEFLTNLAANARAQECWARRFRDFLGIRFQKLPQQPPLSDSTITEKVILN
jgi:hypothetical protein